MTLVSLPGKIFAPFGRRRPQSGIVLAFHVDSLRGVISPDLPLRLLPVLNCSTVLAASLLIQFIGPFGDLRGHIDRSPSHGVKNAPFDHRDLHGVVDDKARYHSINKCRERLDPSSIREPWAGRHWVSQWVSFLSLLCRRFRELRDTCCHAHALSIAALYSPQRATRLHLAR